MKIHRYLAAAFAAVALSSVQPQAEALNIVDSRYSVSTYYTGAESIISFDWSSSGDLYYMTSDSSYFFGGLYRVHNDVTSQVVAGFSEFGGASVVSLNGGIYYNTSDFSNNQKIYRFNLADSTTSLVSSTPNYGVYARAVENRLYITGAVGFGTNHIYYSDVDSSGNFVSDPAIDLGETSGGSGPIQFDNAGNLYYAPGYGDLSIYKWSATEVADALSDPTGSPLSADGHLWLDYSSLYSNVGGGSSMTLDENGNILLTLTSFTDASVLALFEVDDAGAYGGNFSTILEHFGRLGEIRSYDGNFYLGVDDSIVQVIPEPSSVLLLLGGLAGVGAVFHRRRATAAAALLLAATGAVHAGPYAQGSDDPDSATDAPIPGFVGPDGDGLVGGNNVVNPLFVGWASRIISYLPAPGVSAGFADPSKVLGPVTGDNFDIASLGDLYNPAAPPKVSGIPVDPNVTDDAYGFVGYDAPGSITVGFEMAITNGVGADFAVFENGFVSLYTTPDGSVAGRLFAELAFVEVSTDGVHFVRFPSISLTPGLTGAYGTVDPTNLYNLAGKSSNAYGESWGTPFDLDDLANDDLVLNGFVNLGEINYVRLIDIPGSGYYVDSEGNPIYDSWVTWGSGGFDFEALGVIHAVPEPATGVLAALALGGGAWARSRARKVA